MSNSIARKVVLAFREEGPPETDAANLTPREKEIAERLGRGHLYKQIADDLGISFDTVRTHVQRIYKKLHIRSKAQVAQHLNGDRPAKPGTAKST